MTQWIYRFGAGKAEGSAAMKELLGGKGANLAEMSMLGLPVPPGFTITTEVCTYFYDHGRTYPDTLRAAIDEGVAHIEKLIGLSFGNREVPLLVSVRSGARVSMPGMMDTVLNLGLNDETVVGLARQSDNPRFAYDSYRRFIEMYGDVVMGIPHYHFEDILELAKTDRGLTLDTELDEPALQDIVAQYKDKIMAETGREFPQSPQEQLWNAIGAVFASWQTPRAQTYRKLNHIPESWGTAVTVQAMVFGNRGDDCATGVAFTRNPSTGAKEFYGEYLVNAQGEDVVAGTRTPQHLTLAGKRAHQAELPAMEETMPEVFAQLETVRGILERHYRDMQDIEFTVQNGALYMLQTRAGKRTAQAALKIAVDMCAEGLIDHRTALRRIDPASLDQLLHPTLDPSAKKNVLARGLPASPGAACGHIAFSADEAQDRAARGETVILVRVETSPEDIHGMHAAAGIVTTRGGMTSHAAVVARGMGRPCVAGAGDIRIDAKERVMTVKGQRLRDGDIITIDGSSGEIIAGEVPTIQPDLSGDFRILMEWADQVRGMKIRANAETPLDARTARAFGAEGIGLCRTEHMFFEGERIVAMREMIMADSAAGRTQALAKILPMQRADFVEIFEIMRGFPVTIRLLDPPLHEFLPHTEAEMAQVAAAAGTTTEQVINRAQQLQEANPMLGHRGCRLGISFPEIYEMQARAIFEAAAEVFRKSGETVLVEIMIPLVSMPTELSLMKAVVDRVAADVQREQAISLAYMVGTMIELPRAALLAGEIAAEAAFFSFGTNDLTQTTYGLSRDDAARFLHYYEKHGILKRDPFVTLDQEGVGQLIAMACERGRAKRAGIKLGICGEHGGDPASVAFCAALGLDYVSCSPYRVPIAKLAAAQAALG
ncbi:MAG TPA: pyruvate, phosphate dikinase [Dongiaceae bacterium]|jgi:pyruvate,orthophosphate dikinase|nr:pyruvate, phosphate dikinase [Dongiaceae bacterium]